MKYVVRCKTYPQLLTYAPGGERVAFENHLYATDDADLARSLIKSDDVVMESGTLPSPKKAQAKKTAAPDAE